jgi:hypothetical protein
MALSSTIEYCTDRDLQDVYPHIVEYDLKRRIYNWVDLGGDKYVSYNSGLVTLLFADGIDRGTTAITAHGDVDADFEWFYDSATDSVYYHDTVTNPNAQVMEAGDDWADITERMRRKASRLIESRLDYRMAREVVKDREGNYPAIIVHATALQAVIILLKSHDPTNDVIAPFQDEYDEIIEGLSSGRIVLPTAISGDSSKGVIREVDTTLGDLRPVELRGHYHGTGYELLKIKIESGEAGVIGTSKMSVYGKSSTTLKAETLVDSEIITGDFQTLGVGNMEIRWGGDDDAAATLASDEYEIELWGSSLDVSITEVSSSRMTRR